MLGLFAFFYVLLHFLTYVLLDLGLAWDTLLADIAKRPFITVGFTALVLLVPLAITSTNGFQRRLGRNWVKLHRLVYPIAVLGADSLLVADQVQGRHRRPAAVCVLIDVLLGVRVAHWRSVQRQRASQ